jgi:hypothetical protein
VLQKLNGVLLMRYLLVQRRENSYESGRRSVEAVSKTIVGCGVTDNCTASSSFNF